MDSVRTERIFYGALLAVFALLAYFVFIPYAGMVALAAALSIIFRPLYKLFLRAFRYPFAAALVTILFALFIVFIPIVFFGVQIFGEATALYASLSSHGGFDFGPILTRFLQANFPSLRVTPFTLNFNDSARLALTWVLNNFGLLFSRVAQAAFVGFLALLGLFYLLKDGDALKRWILDFLPLSSKYEEQVIQETEAVMSSVMRGTLLVAVIQGLVVGVGFFIFGVPNAAFWGALAAIASLIPMVGAWLVVVPAVAYLFVMTGTAAAVGFGIWSIVLVNVVYDVIAPQLMHRGANIHPFIILLSVLGGLAAFGPIGFLIGPFVVAALFSLLRIYPHIILVKKSRKKA